MTLDEILREEERLRTSVEDAKRHLSTGECALSSVPVIKAESRYAVFMHEHGPTLATAARAGDRLYDYAHHASICTGDSTRPCDCGLVEALAVWDAAAGGAR